MPLNRVRLCFERSHSDLVNKTEQCWMLVDTSTCKLVHDLEYIIMKKFFVDEKFSILNLYLDGFLLPSHEKIEVIRDNDIITVKEDKTLLSKKDKLVKSHDKDLLENQKKRKHECSNDSKNKSKRMKSSVTHSKVDTEGENLTQKKQPSKPDCKKRKSFKTNLKSFGYQSRLKKTANFFHKLSQNALKKLPGDKTTDDSGIQDKRKHEKSSSKNKVKTQTLEKQNVILGKKQVLAPVHPVASGELSSEQITSSTGLNLEKRKIEVEKLAKSLPTVNGSSSVKGVAGSKRQNEKTVKHDGKCVTSSKKSSESSLSVSSATSSSGSSSLSSDSEDNNSVRKNTSNGQHANDRSKVQETRKAINGTAPQKKTQHIGCQLSNPSNHIRFNDSEPDDGETGEPSYSHINVLLNQAKSSTNTGSPHLSPIQPVIKKTTCTNQRGSANRQQNKNEIYTNKSIIMESTRVEKEPEELAIVPDKLPQKDFSTCPLLHGPPRVGETVAYKILELSQSYTPEISQYKEGKVLEFDPAVNTLKLKLTKESLSRAKGDGYISSKFELFDITEGEEESTTTPTEIPDEVEVKWSEMIESRLVAPGAM